MKKGLMLMGLIITGLITVDNTMLPVRGADTDQELILVKICNRDSSESITLISPTDLNNLTKQISLENALSAKALQAAEKAWRELDNTHKPFPRSAITARKVSTIKKFTDAHEASEEYSKLISKRAIQNAKDNKIDEEKTKKAQSDELTRRAQIVVAKSGSSGSPYIFVPDTIPDRLKKQNQDKNIRNSSEEAARELFEQKLAELINASPAPQ